MLFFRIALFILLHGFQGGNSLWTVSKVAVQKGGSITIPCHYYRTYRTNVKYWCKGRSWVFCREIARTTSKSRTEGVFITDYPSEQVFTLTKTNLDVKDTDRYWCAIKMSGFSSQTLRTSLELQVTEDPPDLFVMDNRVSVEEGGNVSIPCLYRDRLKSAEKKWCESGNLHSCRSATSPPEEPSVTISDDGSGVFTVTLMKLERKDIGWYWCSAGDIQAPVHINVTEKLDRFHNITVTTSGGVLASSWAPGGQTTRGPTSEITHPISSALPSSQPTQPPHGTSTAPKTTFHSLLTHNPQGKTSTTAVTDTTSGQSTKYDLTSSAVLTSTVSTTSANGETSDTYSATVTPTDVAPKCAFNNTCSTVPLNTTEDTTIYNRHLIWQSAAIVTGIVMAVVIIVGASFNYWCHHKRRHIRIELDDMTQQLNMEEDLEDDVGNDWPRSCLLYHSEDPESEGAL
ncbi:hypothetical protein AALO_G00120140 [Alosa alosa]|uniref:Ig-like domain-containing protein n=1 Tax=Alosa alosa TaxID=278164 RepID=A0AAV6GJM8_9TELE|nr:uncharacterized protein LOC125300619 [Alosa alosa]KAG5275423.1 hypothetical protein AALO_G00120140 [Alosa alosa]